jgi:polysaccharide export outer membrane protein
MKIRPRIITSTLILVLFLGSCAVTQKKLTYLQYADIPETSELPIRDPRISVTPATYKVMPYDNIYIRVVTPNPEWSALFNPVSTGFGGAMTQESASLVGYPVDTNGEIDIPYVGKVKVAEKTLNEIKVELDAVFRNYVSDAAITVRLVSNYVSIIGNVRSPGRFPISRYQLTVFDALAAAGDIDLYGNRQKIQLIRQSAYGPVVKEFSLTDRSILTSEFFYVMPNDIIYVKPRRGVGFSNNAAIYSVILSTITTTLVVIGFFR